MKLSTIGLILYCIVMAFVTTLLCAMIWFL